MEEIGRSKRRGETKERKGDREGGGQRKGEERKGERRRIKGTTTGERR